VKVKGALTRYGKITWSNLLSRRQIGGNCKTSGHLWANSQLTRGKRNFQRKDGYSAPTFLDGFLYYLVGGLPGARLWPFSGLVRGQVAVPWISHWKLYFCRKSSNALLGALKLWELWTQRICPLVVLIIRSAHPFGPGLPHVAGALSDSQKLELLLKPPGHELASVVMAKG